MRKDFDAYEAIITLEKHALTRFTGNSIHQNMASENTEMQVRIIKDGREGTFTTNRMEDPEAIEDALKMAVKIAMAQKPDKTFPGLPQGGSPIRFQSISPATEKCSPARRATIVKKIVSLASAPPQTEQTLKNFTSEEKFLYEQLNKRIHEWKTQILERKEIEE